MPHEVLHTNQKETEQGGDGDAEEAVRLNWELTPARHSYDVLQEMKIATAKLLALFCILIGTAFAEEELWTDGKISSAQPFQAKIIGVKPGWGWDTLILKEEGKKGRYCLALVGQNLSYTILEPNEFDRAKFIESGATFITPSCEVERFAWSMGVWQHGRRFGDEDAATKYLAAQRLQNEKKENKPEMATPRKPSD